MIGTKILEETGSKYNGNLKVVRTWGMGTYIQADGLTQSGGIVESIWRSTLKKIQSSKFKVQSCLILGLGGGTVAKLIRKNWKEAKITGIDIDPVMVELGKKYLEFDDKKVKIIIADAFNFNRQSAISNQHFDLIVVDLYNGDKFPQKFATENYIHLVRHGLARSGLAVFNRLYYKDKKMEAEKFGLKLQRVFGKVEYFYPQANIMFICSK